ncbi:hypothetical protein [Paenibacillus sp. ACRRY]|uniref:hypothetical protein n=1 Tax=Paenibacillus sp. ACRRY TaxID=2918208 RepID=UPI001EF6A7C2|nr:hypothetical protein [Paenibacillus sp. ACRRY]
MTRISFLLRTTKRKIAIADDFPHVIHIHMIKRCFTGVFAPDLNIIVDNALQNKP